MHWIFGSVTVVIGGAPRVQRRTWYVTTGRDRLLYVQVRWAELSSEGEAPLFLGEYGETNAILFLRFIWVHVFRGCYCSYRWRPLRSEKSLVRHNGPGPASVCPGTLRWAELRSEGKALLFLGKSGETNAIVFTVSLDAFVFSGVLL